MASLNSLIVVQARAAGQDDLGQPNGAWADVCSIFADIRHPSGLETVRGGAEVSTIAASMRVRQRSDVTAAMRVQWAGRTYDIRAVLPDDHGRQFMFLVCKVTQ
jgi:SPP1 family predicted phage head-tail adaptor